MKTTFFSLVFLVSSFAFAYSPMYAPIVCSDPSLFKSFNTAQEAQMGCPKADNVYVTYDWGTKKYTCGCVNNDNDSSPGGGGGGA